MIFSTEHRAAESALGRVACNGNARIRDEADQTFPAVLEILHCLRERTIFEGADLHRPLSDRIDHWLRSLLAVARAERQDFGGVESFGSLRDLALDEEELADVVDEG